MSSKTDYIVQETVTGVVPMLNKERKYNFWDLFSFKQLLINIFCFNIIWIFIECIPIFFAVRYGIDLWVWLRSVLGIKGVAIFATVISMANFGWYGVDAQLFGSSMINLLRGFGIDLPMDIWKPILGVGCVILGTLIALGGPEIIKWTSRVLVTALYECSSRRYCGSTASY